MQRGRQMTVMRLVHLSESNFESALSVVHWPNRKAECAETCTLRLERGKGCEALPIATLHPMNSRPCRAYTTGWSLTLATLARLNLSVSHHEVELRHHG